MVERQARANDRAEDTKPRPIAGDGAAASLPPADTRAAHAAMDGSRKKGSSATVTAQFDAGNPPSVGGGPDSEKMRFETHVVKGKDTLWSIVEARKTDSAHKPTPQEIMQGVQRVLDANPGMTPNTVLHEGRKIKIPEEVNSGIRSYGRQIPGAPTGLVIDGFGGDATVKGIADTSHGGFLAKSFNAMGLNVLKLDNDDEGKVVNERLGRADYTQSLQHAADYIEQNRGQFPPGSFVNTSFGNNRNGDKDPRAGDTTFKELSGWLKMDIKPETVEQQKEEILTRLGRIAKGNNPVTDQPDSSITKTQKATADAAVRTNDQISRIQSMGVEVIHSTGNDGKDKVDINFLRATNLRADGPDGKPLAFSAIGSHTKHGSGIYEFHMVNKNEVATVVNGVTVTFPINKNKLHDKRDHHVDPDKLDEKNIKHGAHWVLTTRKHPQPGFNVGALVRGYEQRVYNIGPGVDYTFGTSFSPLSYVASTRHIARPIEP